MSETQSKATNIKWHPNLTHRQRATLCKQPGLTIWLTGLSASGKSTIAVALEQALLQRGIQTYLLDGDNVRFGLNSNLGFSPADRTENIRRIAEVARLFADSCTVAITSFISPYAADRMLARQLHKIGRAPAAVGNGGDSTTFAFVECFVDVPLEVAEQRDPKGLYKKARQGKIPEFTGISAPYEAPNSPEIHIKSAELSVEEAVVNILRYLDENQLLEVR